jgi:hypothetical protein
MFGVNSHVAQHANYSPGTPRSLREARPNLVGQQYAISVTNGVGICVIPLGWLDTCILPPCKPTIDDH